METRRYTSVATWRGWGQMYPGARHRGAGGQGETSLTKDEATERPKETADIEK